MSLKQMDILRYIFRNIIFGMLRFQVFFWICLKYLVFLEGWAVRDNCGVHSRCLGPAHISGKIQSTPPLGCALIITLANYVKANIRHVNCTHLQQYKLEDLVFT